MSKYAQRYKSASSKPDRGGSEAADFDELPELSAMLAGVRSSDGKSWDAPPCALTLYLEGSYVKFVVGAQDDEVKTFGTFKGLSMGLQGVEQALANEQCETKKVSKSKFR